QHELALDGRRGVQLDDLQDVHQLVQLLGDLFEGQVGDVHHDRHPGDLRMLGDADREGLDVEAAPGEQRGDPGQDAGLVLHEHRQGVQAHRGQSPFSHSGARSRAILMSSLVVPAATIGQTMASLWTMKSITTGASSISMALAMTSSTSSAFSQRRPTQPYASASLTKSGMRLLVCRLVLEYRSL